MTRKTDKSEIRTVSISRPEVWAWRAIIDTCETDGIAVVTTNPDAGFFYLPAGTKDDRVSRGALGANSASQELP